MESPWLRIVKKERVEGMSMHATSSLPWGCNAAIGRLKQSVLLEKEVCGCKNSSLFSNPYHRSPSVPAWSLTFTLSSSRCMWMADKYESIEDTLGFRLISLLMLQCIIPHKENERKGHRDIRTNRHMPDCRFWRFEMYSGQIFHPYNITESVFTCPFTASLSSRV